MENNLKILNNLDKILHRSYSAIFFSLICFTVFLWQYEESALLDIFASLGLPESKFQEGIKYTDYLLGTAQGKAEGDFLCSAGRCLWNERERKKHWVGRVSDLNSSCGKGLVRPRGSLQPKAPVRRVLCLTWWACISAAACSTLEQTMDAELGNKCNVGSWGAAAGPNSPSYCLQQEVWPIHAARTHRSKLNVLWRLIKKQN